MAKTISETPTLKGEHTKKFLDEFNRPNNTLEEKIKKRIAKRHHIHFLE